MSKRRYRTLQNVLLMLTLFVLGASFYFQYMAGLEPCPLCLMQRLCVFLLAICFLVGLWTSRIRHAKFIVFLEILFAMAGFFFAARQLWLQGLPPGSTTTCMPGLSILIDYFSWHDVLKALLWGTGDCAEVTWHLWGLSMAAWSLLYFVTMMVLNGFIFFLFGETPQK